MLIRTTALVSPFSKNHVRRGIDSRAFARETGIAIAWDESLREADFTFEAEEGVKAVVIKPTLTGIA
ncbi:O-succinylbenzoate-CoA synthase [Salmonella enterica subsp. enterica]|nr:O-succinylbenzoate-CoA synthase [Salmonella enterica subsp. enterica] [Salmonella enterica subsp. enterica serovar Menston]